MSLAGGRASGSVRLISPPACPVAVPVDTAIEYLMVKKDFQAALDTCEKGLESLASAEQEESWWVRLTGDFIYDKMLFMVNASIILNLHRKFCVPT